jgi:glutamate racemase
LSTSQQPIGLFDSGVGGLTVLETLVRLLPNENYLYFGDTLHMPYGSKSFSEIEQLVEGILTWLCDVQQVKLVAVACNTSAGVLYEQLAARCPVPLVEPITPICEWLATDATFEKVGLMATPTTVLSNRYASVLQNLNSRIALKQIPCDGLAKLIESGLAGTSECNTLLKGFLDPLVAWGMEALVLGCTHYPHARKQISQLLPAEVQILDPADFMGQRVQHCLKATEQQTVQTQPGVSQYFVSADPEAFLKTAQQLNLPSLSLDQVIPTVLMSTSLPLEAFP